MEVIKNYFLKKQIQKVLASKAKQITFPDKISSIRILANSESELKECEEKVAISFGNSVEISTFYLSKIDIELGISSKDFNLFGRPNERIKRFLEKKVDFILTPSLNLNPYLLYLLLHSKSDLRIGFWSIENKEFLDFMLSQKESSLKENVQNLLDYLIKIKEAC